MKNLILITSVINITKNPLSYTEIRSVYSTEERYEQTKLTLESIKKKIPESKILLIECSNLDKNMSEYLKLETDYYINLYDNYEIREKINSISKSLGEGTLTINALKYIIDNNIEFENLYKISGRYWLSDNFNYDIYNNNNIIIKYNEINVVENINTSLYKIPKNIIYDFYQYLNNNIDKMHNCIGYEYIFGNFINNIDYKKIYINILGVCGYISVGNNLFINI